MREQILVKLLVIFTAIFIASCQNIQHPDAGLDFDQLVRKQNYTVESHKIETEDGYILTMKRIPYGKNYSNGTAREPILLLHGAGSTAAVFIILGNPNAIAYALADNGYDVWLLNTRGTDASLGHKKYDYKTDDKFWDYSLHECGYYDLPAAIQHIRNNTGAKQIFFIGHSQGTTSYFIMTSARPEYNKYIKLGIQFAPSVFLDKNQAIILNFVSKHRKIERYIVEDVLNIHHLFPNNKDVLRSLTDLCGASPGFRYICYRVMAILDFGANYRNTLNENITSLIAGHVPAGVSTKLLFHYLQFIDTGIFGRFDYGLEENLIRYNSTVPPVYNISLSSAPTALFYNARDLFIPLPGVKKLLKLLPNAIPVEIISTDFLHVTYIVSEEVRHIYPQLFTLLNKYKQTKRKRSWKKHG